MEVHRLVMTPVAYSVQSFAAPTSSLLDDFSLPLAFVDPLQILPVATIALIRLVLAIVPAQQGGRPKNGDL